MRATLGGFLALLVLGCGTPTEPPDSQLTSDPQLQAYLQKLKQIETPAGSGPVRLRGKVFLGFETSSIDLCTALTGPCESHEGIGDCHLVLAANGAHYFEVMQDGLFLMEFTGRVSTALEGFGHMNAQLCEVEADQVLSLRETGPLPNDPLGPQLVRSPAAKS
jgi:hypothetical protein